MNRVIEVDREREKRHQMGLLYWLRTLSDGSLPLISTWDLRPSRASPSSSSHVLSKMTEGLAHPMKWRCGKSERVDVGFLKGVGKSSGWSEGTPGMLVMICDSFSGVTGTRPSVISLSSCRHPSHFQIQHACRPMTLRTIKFHLFYNI